MVPKSVRIAFQKTGSLQYISHLDLMRTMQKVFVRSGVPVWYSEGFNPHPKMVFSLPLSIGTESLCEKMDIKIREDMDADEIKNRLNAALTEELKVTEVYIPTSKLQQITWAKYVLTFAGNIQGAESLFADSYHIMKKSKSGIVDVDIVPLIRSMETDGNQVTMLIAASDSAYLNPEHVAKAIAEKYQVPDYSILRENIYFEDGVTPFR